MDSEPEDLRDLVWNEPQQARPYLEKIAASDVKYDKKPQAVELLQKIA